MRTEPLQPIYIVDESRFSPPVQIHSLDLPGRRFYYTVYRNRFRFYPSVTTISSHLLPMGPFFISWVASMGEAEAKLFAEQRAHYGTVMHDICLDFLRLQEYKISDIPTVTRKYMELHKVDMKLYNEWVSDLTKDFLAFAQWVEDFNVKLIAIEYPIVSRRLGFAGRIDIVCTVDVKTQGHFGEVYQRSGKGYKKGDPKLSYGQVTHEAIVDLKSGRKGFYDAHLFQLHAYKKAWNENFGKILKVEKVFNWSPKDWRKNPGYNFKEQTSDDWLRMIPKYAGLAKEHKLHIPSKSYLVVKNNVKIGEELVYSFQNLKENLLENDSQVTDESERDFITIG